MTLLAVDIGGSSIKYGWWKDSQLVDVDEFPTPSSWKELSLAIERLVAIDASVKGLAISIPGVVDAVKGEIRGFSAIPYIHHFPIVAELESLLQIPVAIENDANCAALAEIEFGAAKDVDSAAFFILGSGIGGSVMIDRKLIRGANLFGGEFGYLLLEKSHNLSGLASPVNIAINYSKEEGLIPPIDGRQLFDLSDQGVPSAVKAIEEFNYYLAKGIFNVCLTIDPQVVVIGGAISSRPNLTEPIKQQLEQIKLQQHAENLSIELKVCHFQQKANLVGAVVNFNRWLNKI